MVFDFFRPKARAKTTTASTGGRVVYAVGDIHGHLDLLDDLLDILARDYAGLEHDGPAALVPALVFVGDYVDRGPASKGVIDRLIALKAVSPWQIRLLMGNHEQTLLSFLESPEAGAAWVEFGGGETLASYGVNRPVGRAGLEAWSGAQEAFLRNFPSSHLAFMRELELSAVYGDYLFVHAGVRPGVAFEHQDPQDLMWIRGDFFSQPHGLGKVVVHGHTPDEQPFVGRDRINIDTGAYATGVLTAVRLLDGPPVILQARKSHRA